MEGKDCVAYILTLSEAQLEACTSVQRFLCEMWVSCDATNPANNPYECGSQCVVPSLPAKETGVLGLNITGTIILGAVLGFVIGASGERPAHCPPLVTGVTDRYRRYRRHGRHSRYSRYNRY